MMRRVFRLPATRARLAREVDDELAFHIETRVRQLVASGVAPEAARREAARQFGDLESVRRSCVTMDEQRELSMRRANYMSEVLQDLAFTLRTLRRNAGFATLVVGALAIGIGANTAIFSMIDLTYARPRASRCRDPVEQPRLPRLAIPRASTHTRAARREPICCRSRSTMTCAITTTCSPACWPRPGRTGSTCASPEAAPKRVSSIRTGGSCRGTTSRCSASARRPVGRSTPVRTPSPTATPRW